MNLINWNGFLVNEDNIPENRPGAYGFKNLSNEKWYIGIGQNLERRVLDYLNPQKNWFCLGTAIRRALLKYPAGSFLLVPLYYQFRYDRNQLLDIEASLIESYDSVRNGYNIIRSGKGGPKYGEVFIQICKEANQTPKARMNHSVAATEVYMRPGYREKHRQAIINSLAEQTARNNQLKVLRIIASSFEIKLKRSRSMKKTLSENPFIRITDGFHNKKLLVNLEVPSGWRRGVTFKNKPTGKKRNNV
jgi:group I intron endonuclease